MGTKLKPLKKGDDLGMVGNLVSRQDAQHNNELLKAYDVDRFRHPERGYVIADGRRFVQTIEAIEFTIRSKEYAKGDPAAKEELKKTRDAYLHVLVYDKNLFAKEGKLRLHECMLSRDHFAERQNWKEIAKLSVYLELWEHQAGIHISLNLRDRWTSPATGELDAIETSTSQ